jgi:hypothetical protein
MPCINAISLTQRDEVVPCGKCYHCLKRRSNQWVFRLLQECKVATSISFITLTYSDEYLPIPPHIKTNGKPTLVKKHTQDFWKRLRKNSNSKNLKYYICGEYGERTKRPHYHAIVFNLDAKYQNEQFISDTWQLGQTLSYFNVNEQMLRYTTKYVMKNASNNQYGTNGDNRQPQFSLMSKGIGKSFLTPQMKKHIQENLLPTVHIQGIPTAIPRYYKDKIFDDDDKVLLSVKAQIYREQNTPTYKEWKDYVQHQKYLEQKQFFIERIKL